MNSEDEMFCVAVEVWVTERDLTQALEAVRDLLKGAGLVDFSENDDGEPSPGSFLIDDLI